MLANQIGLTEKVVSEKHYYASQSKYTAGSAAKIISKEIGQKVLAKELVHAYKLINGRDPEWHHSGFYKPKGKSSTMGRTFFFSEEDIDNMVTKWSEVGLKKMQIEVERQRKEETIITGFYYRWESDYNGYRGKRRNFKVLAVYEGNELNKPSNFTTCDREVFEKVRELAGKKYYGWDEPLISEFK